MPRAVELLRGDGLIDGVTVSGDSVTLNLLPLLGLAFTEVQQLGLLENVQLPELTRDGDPDEQIAALSEALGRDLRPDFGQVVVYQGDQIAKATEALDQAQRAVAIGLRAVWVLVALTVVLVAATLLLARERWHALFGLSLALVAMMVVLRTIIHRVVDEAPDLASRPAGASTIAIVLDDLTAGLLRLCAVLIVIGGICVVLSIVRRQTQRRDIEVAAAVAIGVLVVAAARHQHRVPAARDRRRDRDGRHLTAVHRRATRSGRGDAGRAGPHRGWGLRRRPQRPVTVARHSTSRWWVAAGILALSVVGSSRAAAAPPTDAEAELLTTFAPIIAVRAQAEPCGDGERFRPVAVDAVLGRDDVVLRDADGAVVVTAPDGGGSGGRWRGPVARHARRHPRPRL